MPIDVPTWDSDLDEGCWVKLQVLCQLFHAMPEVFAPLTTDIICYDNPWELLASQCRKNDVVHVAVPDIAPFCPIEFGSKGNGTEHTVHPFVDHQLHSFE
jgi:hypothetical protein